MLVFNVKPLLLGSSSGLLLRGQNWVVWLFSFSPQITWKNIFPIKDTQSKTPHFVQTISPWNLEFLSHLVQTIFESSAPGFLSVSVHREARAQRKMKDTTATMGLLVLISLSILPLSNSSPRCKAWLVQSIPTDMPSLPHVSGVLPIGTLSNQFSFHLFDSSENEIEKRKERKNKEKSKHKQKKTKENTLMVD